MSETDPLLVVEDLVVDYYASPRIPFGRGRAVRAVDGVSIVVYPRETLGIVGESGCGKTTLGRALVRLVPASRGRILFAGTDLLKLRGKALRLFRPTLQMVFQNPASSLDPRMSVFDLVAEGLRASFRLSREEMRARVQEVLARVGIYESLWNSYPSALSGGQAQRVAIARALAVRPRLLVLDEPTSALDVSVQAQVANLLKQLQVTQGLTYIFISHDLSLVDYMSDRIAVMYLGQVIEIGSRTEILRSAVHPYTQALLSASPVPDPDHKRSRIVLEGSVPDAARPPAGCRFHPRCWQAREICRQVAPKMIAVASSHQVACHLVKG